MNAKEKQAYIRGRKSAFRSLLGECARELVKKDLRLAGLLSQLHDAREALRLVCKDHGDNDWTDDLRLADVTEIKIGDDDDPHGLARFVAMYDADVKS